MRQECYLCHLKTIDHLVNKFNPTTQSAEALLLAVKELLANKKDMPNPLLATEIHRIARVLLNNDKLYKEEKFLAYDILLKNYSFWKKFIDQSSNPFYTAAKLTVIGNIIDYGAHTVSGNISDQIDALLQQDLKVDMTRELKSEIKKAGSVLYLGDNGGEIVFDKLFIEHINHPNLTYVVRGQAVINDVTLDDARQVEMSKVCRVISNGFDAPSTLIDYCSGEFKEAFENADLVISKGQGNFEGLLESIHPNIFFLLIAKCNPIAELLGVRKKDMVIKKLNKEFTTCLK